jgi:Cu2+-exporting ATPase
MKNFFLSAILLAMMAACGGKSSHNATQSTDTNAPAAQAASDTTMAVVYQCPMKCEGDKTYDKPGKCPKCEMDLAEVKDHEGHDH